MSKDKSEPTAAEKTAIEEEKVETEAPDLSGEKVETSEKNTEKKKKNEVADEKKAEKPAKTPKKEKAAAEGKKKKEEEEAEEEGEKVVEEKILTINLRHSYLAYSRKPTPRSVKLVRKVASKVFKTEEGVKIDNSLNSILWARGKTKAQRRVVVKVQKLEDGTVRVLPAAEA